MFAYEILTASKAAPAELNQPFKYSTLNKSQSTVVVYNFHSLHSQNRFFIFTQNIANSVKSKFLTKNDSVDSIAELFPAAN